MKLKAVIAVSVLAIAAATGGWMYYRYESAPKNLELYGNVDIRQVNLAFLWPERIKSILVEEGDKKEMVDKINYLIENEKNRKKIGTNARKYVLQYSQKNIMDKWNILFNNCLTLTS